MANAVSFAAVLGSSAALAQQPPFAACVDGLRERAIGQGIDAALAERVLADVEPLERVIAADRSQPEFVDTFAEYLGRRISTERVARGRDLYREHAELLSELTARHGVPGQYLLSFWALETNYGSFLGNVPVFDALATLACDERRSEYFSVELVNALQIVARGDIDSSVMRGSWAGAMGHTQFMPSAYLDYAVDGDGDQRVDLFGSVPDALASAATYLAALDWRTGYRWGREVLLPEDFDYALSGAEQPRSLRQWRDLGLTNARGDPVAELDVDAALLLPSGQRGPAFLVYDNFEVIMRWNRSEFFALTVGHLADRIAGGDELARPPPSLRVRYDELVAVQLALTQRGHDVGPADGRLGPRTRRAIRDFQVSQGIAADGFPDASLLRALQVIAE